MIIIIFTMSTIIILMMIRLTMSVHGSEQKQMFFPKLLHSPPVTSIQYHRLLTQMTVMIMIFMILMIFMIFMISNPGTLVLIPELRYLIVGRPIRKRSHFNVADTVFCVYETWEIVEIQDQVLIIINRPKM